MVVCASASYEKSELVMSVLVLFPEQSPDASAILFKRSRKVPKYLHHFFPNILVQILPFTGLSMSNALALAVAALGLFSRSIPRSELLLLPTMCSLSVFWCFFAARAGGRALILGVELRGRFPVEVSILSGVFTSLRGGDIGLSFDNASDTDGKVIDFDRGVLGVLGRTTMPVNRRIDRRTFHWRFLATKNSIAVAAS